MTIFGLVVVAIFSYMDWLTHRELVVAVVLGGAAAAVILFHREVVERANLGPYLSQIPAPVRPILSAVPGVVYFLSRGQGTSGAGGIVLIAILLSVGAVALFGRAIDSRLAGFYTARDRILPLPVRMVLALVLPILTAFLIIHGSLADIPALFGGTTSHPMSPDGRGGSFFLGTVVSAVLAYSMLRGTQAVVAGSAAPALAAALAPAGSPAAIWTPTHVVPPGGLPAWASPDAAAAAVATLDPGLPVKLLQLLGDWAQIEASNGWTGWVDSRTLVRGTG